MKRISDIGHPASDIRKGIIFVISGPSGSGKGSVIGRVVQEMDGVEISVSATSRECRPNEHEGVDYYFLSPEEFERRKGAGGFVEWAEYCGDYYGTLRSEIFGRIEAGVDVLLEIDVQGGRQIRAQLADSVLIMLLPPTCAEARRRLEARATDSPEEIAARVEVYGREIQALPEYDYLVWNDRLEDAVADVGAIIRAERAKTLRADLDAVREEFLCGGEGERHG